MFLNISLLEWIGYLSSVLVAVSLTMSSIVKLRWLNLIGAGFFSFYGFAIGSLPVGLLNLFIVLANIYYLIKIYSRKETFKLIHTTLNESYLQYFLDFNNKEIETFFPDFMQFVAANKGQTEDAITLLLLRDAQVAGVFFGIKKSDELFIYLDYVSAPYRDLKPGEYIYRKKVNVLKDLGVKHLICEIEHPHHKDYLRKMGFVEDKSGDKNRFIKEV
ncbi:MAG: hypothetical protein VB046_01265 [Paludibacter sp.]|nr:hypothetical protein [Paludibacter sp.]